MFSLIGFNFPTLAVAVVCVFSIVLLPLSISDNLNARRTNKRKQAADRNISSSHEVTSR